MSCFNWCLTLNNYSDAEYSQILSYCESDECRYWIIGKEVGDEGTPHLQGFFSLRRRRNLGYVRSKCGSRIHFEVARGTARQNRAYCSKDGNFAEGGECPAEGRKGKSRDELALEFRDAVVSGNGGILQFSDANPGSWYYSGYNLLRNHQLTLKPRIRPDIHVEWVWGPPGVGKSRYAHDKMPDAYVKEPRTKWWNGYLQETEVIIDDFGPLGIDINHLLRWFDRYKCLVETKGGMLPLFAEKFIVTSNFEPSDCWKDKDGVPHPQMDALYRRIELKCME